MSSTNFNVGIAANNKISTRVLKPPGGDHSDIFAPPKELVQQPRVKNIQQDSSLMGQIMGKKYEEPAAEIQDISNNKVQQDSAPISKVVGKEYENATIIKQSFNTKNIHMNSTIMGEIMGKSNEISDAGKPINCDVNCEDIECKKLETPSSDKQTNSGKAFQQDSSLMDKIMGKSNNVIDEEKHINRDIKREDIECKKLESPAAGKQTNSGKTFQQDSSLMGEIMGKNNKISVAEKEFSHDIKYGDVESKNLKAPAAGKQTNSSKSFQQDSSLMGEIMGKNNKVSDAGKQFNHHIKHGDVESKKLEAPAAGKQTNSGKAFQQDSSLMDEIMGKIPCTPKAAFESSRGKAPPGDFSKGMW